MLFVLSMIHLMQMAAGSLYANEVALRNDNEHVINNLGASVILVDKETMQVAFESTPP